MAKASIEQSAWNEAAPEADGSDKRRSERAPLVVRVDYTTVDAFFSEFTANINEGGMFVETDSPAPMATAVLLKFKLPGEDDPIKLSGRVVWTSAGGGPEGPGMGIEFENLDGPTRARIDTVVRNLRRRDALGGRGRARS
jgi:type IV pilus assembly protein PilZ